MKSIIITAILCLTLVAGLSAAPAFSYDFEYASNPTVGTVAGNLNDAAQFGTWSGIIPAGAGNGMAPELIGFQTVAGSNALLMDRPVAQSVLTANFAHELGLGGSSVAFDFALRRGGNNHEKDIHIIGRDSLGTEAFHLQISAENVNNQTAGADRRRIGVISTGNVNPDYTLANTFGNDTNNDIAAGATPSMARIRLTLAAAGFQIDFSRGNRVWQSQLLGYNGVPIDLASIDFVTAGHASNNNFRGGFFLDNVSAIPEPSTAFPLMALIVAVGLIRRKRAQTC